ncbi:hypothetical protein T4B_508 [Trichinella pseudospiralis]|uniref:Uncharacterized protein n=1 Tax=Trichinella pseudospiralis TaxID=6337 RepID=A0A0V1IUN6_TRIPS|nr:hypothetical protein T4B_508 [Trichinella pseudospiralis]KRZ33228.1 hypothetical protein T4C_8962 [Trichinella pseudospiralis]
MHASFIRAYFQQYQYWNEERCMKKFANNSGTLHCQAFLQQLFTSSKSISSNKVQNIVREILFQAFVSFHWENRKKGNITSSNCHSAASPRAMRDLVLLLLCCLLYELNLFNDLLNLI